MPRLLALSDIHVGHPLNTEALAKLRPHPPGTGLIVAGDIGETREHLEKVFKKTKECFTHVFWVPGNHELYSVMVPNSAMDGLRGEEKYKACVEVAREYGVLTPEDPWMTWEYEDEDVQSQESGSAAGASAGEGGSIPKASKKAIIALCFLLYDYSFRPESITRENVLQWSLEEGIEATDEHLLHPDPYPTRDAWCHTLCDRFADKLKEYSTRYPGVPFVLVNHWPLREDLIYIPRVPRFTPWCGTKRTARWHQKGELSEDYPGAVAVISGHLHVRRTDVIDGVRFEECSLGYPRQWEAARNDGKDINDMIREIFPGQQRGPSQGPGTWWRMKG